MKTTKTLNILALLLSLLLFVGCEKDVNDERLRVTPENIEIGYEGGTVQVDIESTSGWKVIVPSDCTWVKSDRYESEIGRRQWIKLTISKNNTEKTRNTTITIRNSGQSRDITITQTPISLNVSPESIYASQEKTTKDISINSNISWSAKSSDSWITISKSSGDVGYSKTTITIAKNTTANSRTGHVEIYNKDYNVSKKVAVTQKVASLTINPESIEVGAESITKKITIESNIEWIVNSHANWITLSKSSGTAGTTTLNVNIEANTLASSRTGQITVYNQDYNITKKIVVNQAASTISVSTNSIEVGPESSTQNINITSNIPWTAKTSDSWITLSKSTGYAGTTILTINIGANTSTSSRSGYVELYNTEYNVSKRVDINQIAFSPELSVSPNSFDVGVEATTKTVTIESNFSWTAKTSKSWIYVSKLSGSAGTTTLTIDIDANMSISSRSGYVELYNTEYNVSKRVDINQIAFSPELSVSPNSFDVGVEATTKTVTIESNFSWTAKTSKSWIYVSKLSGSAGTTTLTIDIDANMSISSRSGYIEFYNAEYGVSKRVEINQTAFCPELKVSHNTLNVEADAITKIITIESNISWSASVSANWISLSKSSSSMGNDAIILTIEQNTTGIARSGYVEISNSEYNISRRINIQQNGYTPTEYCIEYTSTSQITIDSSAYFGALIESHTWNNGNGVIRFDGPVTSIGEYAFYNCSSLTSISIPNSVTSIGGRAFYNCSSLTSITIPESVTSIGDYAFCGCSSLKSITIPNSVTSIGGSAFYNCSSLTSITIPESVTTIGGCAFTYCKSLTTAVIGKGIESIGQSAFSDCSSLTNVYSKATIPPSLGSGAFSWTTVSLKIYVPTQCVDAYKNADGWDDYDYRIVGYDFQVRGDEIDY